MLIGHSTFNIGGEMPNRIATYCILTLLILGSEAYAQSNSWRRLFDGETPAVATNPQNANSIYTFDGHFQVSYDRGLTWQQRGLIPGVFRQILVHPLDTTTIFGAGSGGLRRSTDYGMTWDVVLPNLTIDGESMVFDPQRPDTMFAGNLSDASIYRSINRGETWTWMGDAGGGLCTLIIRPDSSNILYAGTGGGKISKSTDYGATWRLVHSSGAIEIPKIVIDPSDPLTAYATSFSGPDSTNGLLKTTDGGEHWQLMFLRGLALWALDVSPTNPNVIYSAVFSQIGASVYRTTNAGAVWDTLNAGYPPGGASWNLKVSLDDPGTVWLALTIGTSSGIYSWVPMLDVPWGNPEAPMGFSLEQNYPNPFNPTTSIEFRVASLAPVSLRVFDVLGGEVRTLVNETMKPGTHGITFDATGLSSGVYFYRLHAGSFVETKKMILTR
jgi:photosystem II stability/assembly factor-like uncharacterized protein